MIDNRGRMFLEDNDIIELMLANRQVKILPSNKNSYIKFEGECKKYGIASPFTLDEDSESINWKLPEDFRNLDIFNYIKTKHADLSKDQLTRVAEELKEFERRNLTDLLRFLCYFVTILRSNNVIYGVGRGSSIASYVLYLLGVHRIDSYKFNLDIKEFLK